MGKKKIIYPRGFSKCHETDAWWTRLSLKNSYIAVHEYPTNGLVADIRSQADGQKWSVFLCYFTENA